MSDISTYEDIIYACFNPDCDGNGFVIGEEGAVWTCGYCGGQLLRKYNYAS